VLYIIDKAMKFAATAHDRTYRKNNGKLPYIYHPTMLAFYLQKYNFDEEIVAAALLHDTVEDTEIELDEIKSTFGNRIHYLVAACTEDKSKSWEDRKQHQIDAISTADIGVVAIKCADKLHNISDLVIDYQKHGDDIWSIFNRGKEKQEWYYKAMRDSFANRPDFSTHPLFLAFEDRVKILFE
jgi:(p)ppGpp synthase/HD superfamily hydrolase